MADPDFEEIQRLLRAVGADWDPAEAHGAFCGRACLSGTPALTAWLRELVPATGALSGEQQGSLQGVAAASLLGLEAGQMGFNLLLPDDDAPLALRAECLAEWCHGFMHGFAAVGTEAAGAFADDVEAEVVAEILTDFSAITKAAADAEVDEASEAALFELVEYVRVSAQLVYEETAPQRAKLAAQGDAS